MVAIEIVYPENCTSEKAEKKFRKRLLKANPDTLYADCHEENGVKIRSNLIFYTTQIDAWKLAIRNLYVHNVENQIEHGKRLIICQGATLDTSDPFLTISCYTTGIVLVQGYEASLNAFEENFPELKITVVNESDRTRRNRPENSPSPTQEQQGDEPQIGAEETSPSIPELTDAFKKLTPK